MKTYIHHNIASCLVLRIDSGISVVSPDTAVSGVGVVPQTVSQVSDLTVDSINAVPETIDTVTDLGVSGLRNAPANTIR